ncbi:MAG: hypothetical protein GY714_19635 [Desulfobacterales bacterium]|nr:hypothetical protein [Desulfobacterales bacterium]
MCSYSNPVKYLIAVVLSIVISGSAYAKEGDSIFLVGQIGIATGGDQLVGLTYSDGTTEDIDGGDGDYLNVGFFVKPFSDRNFETQITAGFKEHKSEATNGTVKWSRYTVDLIQFYRFENFRIGFGGTYHFDPKVKGTGVASSLNETAADTFGLVSEIDWFLGKREICEVFLGFKYTNIDYEFNGRKFSGDSIGAHFGIYF